MKYRPLPALLLPFVILAVGCGGGGGDNDNNSSTANPFAFSGTKTGTFNYNTGSGDEALNVTVTGTISKDGTFRFSVKDFEMADEVLTGKVDEFGTVSSASRVVTSKGDFPSYTQNGRGSISRSGNKIGFTLGFASNGNEDGPDYTDYRYVGSLN